MEVSFIKDGNTKERTDFEVEMLGKGKMMNSVCLLNVGAPQRILIKAAAGIFNIILMPTTEL